MHALHQGLGAYRSKSQGPRVKHTCMHGAKQNDFAQHAGVCDAQTCMHAIFFNQKGRSLACKPMVHVRQATWCDGTCRHVCSIYTKLRKPKRYVFWFKSSGPMAHSLLQAIQNRQATKNVHSLEVLLLLGIVFQRPFGVLRILISSGDP